jgi:hypothetical protein
LRALPTSMLLVILPPHVLGPKYERRQRPRNSQRFRIGKSRGNLAMTPDVAGVISLNRFMAPVDDNVTTNSILQRPKSPATVEYLRTQTENGTIWVAYQYVERQVMTWGMRTSNLSEVVNSRLLSTRNFPLLLSIMSTTTRHLSLDIVQSKEKTCKLLAKGHCMTPFAQKMVDQVKVLQDLFQTHPVNHNICYVNSVRGGQETDPLSTCRVTFPDPAPGTPGSCTCQKPMLPGLFCEHAYCAGDDPFIVLTETKFSISYIPVWDRYLPFWTRVKTHAITLSQ